MDRPLIAESELVKIAVVSKDDIHALWVIDNDPEGARFLRFPGEIYLQNDMEKLLERLSSEKERLRLYTILVAPELEVAGSIGLYDIDWRRRSAYIGYGIAKKFWNRGIMSESVRLMVSYSFVTMNLRKLVSSVMAPNIASMRVLEKNGFSRVGTFRENGYVPGVGWADEVYYELFSKNG